MRTESYDVYLTNFPAGETLDEVIRVGLDALGIDGVSVETNFCDSYGD